MRFAILSDLHSNLQAWRAVAADLKQAGVDQVVCLGDIVGYGPNPAEVLEEVAGLADHVVLGNHDAVIGGRFDSDCFSDQARIAIEWTQGRLNRSATEFFQQMPSLLRGEGFAVSHAEFQIPERFDYIFEPAEAVPSFRATADDVMFFGHTHVPGVFRMDRETGEVDLVKPGQLLCNPAYRYLINVGSVGDPRDGDTRSSYVIYDAAQQRVDFRKVAFDIPAYQSALRRSRLPTQPMFFQFLDPNITPAVTAARTRVFRAGEAQVRLAAQGGASRTMVLDPTRRSAGMRAAGSGAFAQRGRTPARKRQLAVIAGVCALLFVSLAVWILRQAGRGGAGATIAGGPGAPPPVSASQLGSGLSLLLGGEPGTAGSMAHGVTMSAGVRPAPGVTGQGLEAPSTADAVSWTPPSAAAMTFSWWLSQPAGTDGLIWASGESAQLLRRGDDLVLRQGRQSSTWGPLPRGAVTPMSWDELSLGGRSFTFAAWLRLEKDGVLYGENTSSGMAGLAVTVAADRLAVTLGTNRWASAAVPPRPREWRPVAVVYDHGRGRLQFYADGEAAGEATADLPVVSGAAARLGSVHAEEPSCSGELDDLWIFRRALSPAEVRGLADHRLESALADSPAVLNRLNFDSPGLDGFLSPAGRGFDLRQAGATTAAGPAGRGRALRLGGTGEARFSPGFAETGADGALHGLPRPEGWHQVALVLRPGEGTAAPTVSLVWDGEEVPLREGGREWRGPVSAPVRWTGPGRLDELAAWTRPLRAPELREIAARTHVTRADHPLGSLLRPGWLRQEESLLTGLAMESGTKADTLARVRADLVAMAERVRGTPLWARVQDRLRDVDGRVTAEIARLGRQLEVQANAFAGKGEFEKAALVWDSYAGAFSAELAAERADRAAQLRRQDGAALAKSTQEARDFFQRAWVQAAQAVLEADWNMLGQLARTAEEATRRMDAQSASVQDARLLRALADTPQAALGAFGKLEGQQVDLELHASRAGETLLVPAAAVWRYHVAASAPEGWTAPDFADAGWPSGPAPLGYGDAGLATTVEFGGDPGRKHITAWFRHSFQLADPSAVGHLALRLLVDDGAVLHLNGRELHRRNMPPGPVAADTLAAAQVGNPAETQYAEITLGRGLLQRGRNVLAAEVHQSSAGSSDLRFDLELKGVPTGKTQRGSYHVEGVVSNRLHVVQLDAAGRNRRIAVDLAAAPLQTVVARLPPGDPTAQAALRAAAFCRVGKLDRALAELQSIPHPLAAALRDRIVAEPAAAGAPR